MRTGKRFSVESRVRRKGRRWHTMDNWMESMKAALDVIAERMKEHPNREWRISRGKTDL